MAKIILVEDEINIASFIERGLREFGHEVSVVYDGNAGWELLQNESFDLLILDIIMPGMNGLELCRMYRQRFGYHSPVVMLTALGTTDDIVKLVCGDLILDCTLRRARRGNMDIDLTVKEYRLLEYFLLHQRAVLSRLTLLRDVWDKNFDTNTNVVDVYVNYLRAKIDKGFEDKLIHTVVGVGYMMTD